MASAVHQFFLAQALQLKEGQIGDLARVYSIPLVVALPGADHGFVVLSARSEVEHFFRLTCEGLQQAGISCVRVKVNEGAAWASERATATVEWYYIGPTGAREGQTTARYFLERREGALSVQMIELERVAMPAILTWLHAAGRPTARRPEIPLH